MSLRSVARDARVPPILTIPLTPGVATQEAILAQKFDLGHGIDVMDADALIKRLRQAAHDDTWASITFRDWKRAAWVLFNGEEPLCDEPGFLSHLIAEYGQQHKKAAYSGLIQAYIRDFDPHRPATDTIARALRSILSEFHWKWSDLHSRHALFTPKDAPTKIAEACLPTRTDPLDVLASAGIGGAAARGSLAAHVYLQVLLTVRKKLSNGDLDFDLLERVMKWSAGSDGLVFPAYRATLADSLLLPWANNNPDEELKAKILPFLLENFRDPRLPANAKEWLGVSQEAVAVARRWLTGLALEQFFDVVDQVAQESMWRYRRSFWLAYHKRHVVDDAWVLFGSEALSYARRAFDKAQSYGTLERTSQVQANHSVLLMRIGKLTVADWSHNGKCHIWLDGNPKAPKLYHPRYPRGELVTQSDNAGQVHYGSEHGTWQRSVEAYIRNHTSISVPEREYMPKPWKQ